MTEPLFSIVIACYNQEAFVRQAVESALRQECSSKEVIAVDDGSQDGTPDVLDTFGESIILAKLPMNGGVAAARNHGSSLACGKYLVFLDGDDVLMPWALDTYACLIGGRCPKVLFGRPDKCYGQVPEVKTSDFPRDVHFVEYPYFLAKDRSCVFNTSTLVVDRATFWTAGGWSPGIFYQDIQDLLAKLGPAGKTILVLAPDTVWYRMHSTNAVRKVAPFVKGVHTLLAKAEAGVYPGCPEQALERSAWFGGLIVYWTAMSIRAGLYRDAFGLLASGWWMPLLAVLRRGTAWLAGRKSVEVLPLQRSDPVEPLAQTLPI